MMVIQALLAASILSAAPAPCDGPGADPWVAGFRDRVVAYDGLAAWAAQRFGAPTSCEGERTKELDGASYGVLRLGFAGGLTLVVETMPPETSVTALQSDEGFADEASVREALRAYAEGIGLRIDWTAPEATESGAERTERYWDPDRA